MMSQDKRLSRPITQPKKVKEVVKYKFKRQQEKIQLKKINLLMARDYKRKFGIECDLWDVDNLTEQ